VGFVAAAADLAVTAVDLLVAGAACFVADCLGLARAAAGFAVRGAGARFDAFARVVGFATAPAGLA